jgi:hypothetical protein
MQGWRSPGRLPGNEYPQHIKASYLVLPGGLRQIDPNLPTGTWEA